MTDELTTRIADAYEEFLRSIAEAKHAAGRLASIARSESQRCKVCRRINCPSIEHEWRAADAAPTPSDSVNNSEEAIA